MRPVNAWRLKRVAWLALFPITSIISLSLLAGAILLRCVDEELVSDDEALFICGIPFGEWIRRPK